MIHEHAPLTESLESQSLLYDFVSRDRFVRDLLPNSIATFEGSLNCTLFHVGGELVQRVVLVRDLVLGDLDDPHAVGVAANLAAHRRRHHALHVLKG